MRCEELSSAPRYFELFSRSGPRERWDMHGDEVGKVAPRERRGGDFQRGRDAGAGEAMTSDFMLRLRPEGVHAARSTIETLLLALRERSEAALHEVFMPAPFERTIRSAK